MVMGTNSALLPHFRLMMMMMKKEKKRKVEPPTTTAASSSFLCVRGAGLDAWALVRARAGCGY